MNKNKDYVKGYKDALHFMHLLAIDHGNEDTDRGSSIHALDIELATKLVKQGVEPTVDLVNKEIREYFKAING